MDLKGTRFIWDEEVGETMKSQIKVRPSTHFNDGMKQLVTCGMVTVLKNKGEICCFL